MDSEDAVLEFAGASFRSVWALELLIALRRARDRTWTAAEIIKELRGSRVVVTEALENLLAAALVIEDESGGFRYRVASSAVEETIDALEKLYALKPTLVVRKIVTSPNAKLQILSDAFRIKK